MKMKQVTKAHFAYCTTLFASSTEMVWISYSSNRSCVFLYRWFIWTLSKILFTNLKGLKEWGWHLTAVLDKQRQGGNVHLFNAVRGSVLHTHTRTHTPWNWSQVITRKEKHWLVRTQHENRLTETKHWAWGLSSDPERGLGCLSGFVCVCAPRCVYTDHFVKLTGLMEDIGNGSTLIHKHEWAMNTQRPPSANHTRGGDHTYRIHPNHTKRRTHTRIHTQKLLKTTPVSFCPPHPPHSAWWRQAQIVGLSEPSPEACCERTRLYQVQLCVCLCASPIVRQGWPRRRPAGAQTGSQIISLCSKPNTHTHIGRPASLHTEYWL